MNRSRVIESIALGVTLAALAVTTAGAQQDLRSPDTRDAAAATTQGPQQDMRSPDARDASQGRGTFSAPDVTVIKVSEPSISSNGFEWQDAAIGAGVLLGTIMLALAGTLAVRRRHGFGHAAPGR